MAPQSEYSEFSLAVSKINNEINEEIKIERNAKDVFAMQLYFLARSIAQKAVDRCREAGKERLEQSDVASVMNIFFSNDVLKFAHAEGFRNVFLHETGFKVFTPKEPRLSRTTAVAQSDRSIPAMFGNAVRSLKQEVLRLPTPARFDEGLKRIDVTIANVANSLLNDLCQYVSENNLLEIDNTHVKEGLKKFLKGELMKHANSQGDRQVSKYLTGQLKYDTSSSDTSDLVSSRPRKISRRTTTKGKSPKKSAKSVRTVNEIRTAKPVRKGTTAKKAIKRKDTSAKKTGPVREAKKMKKSSVPKKSGRVKKQSTKSTRKPAKNIARKRSAQVPRRVVQGALDYSPGIQQLLDQSNTEAERDGIGKMNSVLMEICGQFVEECTAQNVELTVGKIRDAVVGWLPAKLARHALAHAANTVLPVFTNSHL